MSGTEHAPGVPTRGRLVAMDTAEQAPALQPRPLISVAVPIYNEEAVVDELLQRLVDVADTLADRYRFEFIFVDDGSADDSLARLKSSVAREPRLRVLELRTNYGQTAALQAGFDGVAG